MNKKLAIVIECLWIVLAVFSLGVAIYYHVTAAIKQVWLLYCLAAIALGMFAVRRMQRKNNEKRQRH